MQRELAKAKPKARFARAARRAATGPKGEAYGLRPGLCLAVFPANHHSQIRPKYIKIF